MSESTVDFIRRRCRENQAEVLSNPALQRELAERAERTTRIVKQAEENAKASRRAKTSGAGKTMHFAQERDV